MTKLSPEAIQEFKELWQKEFGEELSDAKASEEANDLLTLMRLAKGEKNVLS